MDAGRRPSSIDGHAWAVKRVGGMLGRTRVTMQCALCGEKRVVRSDRAG